MGTVLGHATKLHNIGNQNVFATYTAKLIKEMEKSTKAISMP